jgi:phage terminase large subunit-like protein
MRMGQRVSAAMSARSRRSGRTIRFHPDWAAEIWLALAPGNETDFEEIKTDVRRLCSRFQIMSVRYDPWQY